MSTNETSNTTPVPGTDAPSQDAVVTFAISGVVNGTVNVPVGTKVKDAIKKIDASAAVGTLTLRGPGDEPVGIERGLTQSLTVTSVKKASGG